MRNYKLITELNEFSSSKLDEFQILLIPDKYGSLEEEFLVNTDDAISFKKELLLSGVKCADSYELDIDTRNVERRGGDIWLGQIFILDSAILPIFIGLLTNYISNKFRLGQRKIKITEEPTVKLEIKLYRDGKIDSLKYDGGGELLLKVIETFKDK